MTTIVTRAVKGLPLTHVELDANFVNLNDDKLEKSLNLSDLDDASVARTNLGLGTIATQDADDVNITGGTFEGVSVAQLSQTATLAKLNLMGL